MTLARMSESMMWPSISTTSLAMGSAYRRPTSGPGGQPGRHRARPGSLAASMGQTMTVVEKRSSRPDVVVFELNRSLTGMGHERYRALEDAAGNRPPDHVARILFEHG